MKKILIAMASIMVMSILFTGCVVVNAGPVTTRTFDYLGFESVDIGSAFQAEVVQSNEWRIEITAPDSLFDHLVVAVDGHTLKIGLRNNNSWNYRRPKARITMPELYTLKISGASIGSATGFASNHDTDVYVSGASKLDLDLGAYDTRMLVSGASHVTGHLDVHDFRLEINGASKVNLSGSGNTLDIQASGASRVDMQNFNITDVSAGVSGASRVTISPSGKMSVSLSGASSLYYTGNPQLESIEVSGSSTIRKK